MSEAKVLTVEVDVFNLEILQRMKEHVVNLHKAAADLVRVCECDREEFLACEDAICEYEEWVESL